MDFYLGGKVNTSLFTQLLDAGFKSSRKFSKKLHLWDLLDRVHEQLPAPVGVGVASEVGVGAGTVSMGGGRRLSEGGGSHEEDCRDLFHKAVSRINSNNPNIGKDEKVSEHLILLLHEKE